MNVHTSTTHKSPNLEIIQMPISNRIDKLCEFTWWSIWVRWNEHTIATCINLMTLTSNTGWKKLDTRTQRMEFHLYQVQNQAQPVLLIRSHDSGCLQLIRMWRLLVGCWNVPSFDRGAGYKDVFAFVRAIYVWLYTVLCICCTAINLLYMYTLGSLFKMYPRQTFFVYLKKLLLCF